VTVLLNDVIEVETCQAIRRELSFAEVLGEITEVHSTGPRTDRVLRDEYRQNFIFPWLSHQNLLKISARFLRKNPAELLPFSELEINQNNLGVDDWFTKRFIFAIVFHVLNTYLWRRSTQQLASVHFALQWLLAAHKILGTDVQVHTRPQLSARIVPELVEHFNDILVDEFFWTPVSHGGRD
jgi:hypothetical protein